VSGLLKRALADDAAKHEMVAEAGGHSELRDGLRGGIADRQNCALVKSCAAAYCFKRFRRGGIEKRSSVHVGLHLTCLAAIVAL
jgi:hypothetical protein